MFFSLQMPLIGPPVIGIKAPNPKGLQQLFQFPKYLIFAPPKGIRQDQTGLVIDRMPQPPGLLLAADKAPHLIHVSGFNSMNFNRNFCWTQPLQQGLIDRFKERLFFLTP